MLFGVWINALHDSLSAVGGYGITFRVIFGDYSRRLHCFGLKGKVYGYGEAVVREVIGHFHFHSCGNI